jgi:predicted PolB exonuclease-like 3'-5' exonuclease
VYTAGDVDEEVELLKSIEGMLDNTAVTLVGHNIKGFDIPFLAKRFMARRKFVPRMLNMGGKKPWEVPHIDTMDVMRFGGGASMSLRSAYLMLGIADPKGSNCGSEVPEMFRQGKVLEIGQYCGGDVVAERELYKRLVDAEVFG